MQRFALIMFHATLWNLDFVAQFMVDTNFNGPPRDVGQV
jgi:hypothetical protein